MRESRQGRAIGGHYVSSHEFAISLGELGEGKAYAMIAFDRNRYIV